MTTPSPAVLPFVSESASTSTRSAASVPAQFGLYLSAVRVQDFRALRDVTVALQRDTTVLIGENNSGKTSFIEALSVGLGDRRPRPEDLYLGPDGRAPEFQIDFRIEPASGDEFVDSVRDVVGDAIQLESLPEYFVVRVSGTINEDGLDVTLRRSFLKGWGVSRKAAVALPILKSPGVGRETLSLLQFDMLDARRDIVEQLRNRRTFWGRTTSTMDMAPGAKDKIEASLRALGNEVTAGSATLGKVKADLAALSEALSHGSLGVEIEPLPQTLDDLVRAMDIMITAPSSSSFAISTQGMGTRSLAALLIFRSYINLVRPRLNAERLLSLSAFEEPEAHLHPQAQCAVFRILSQIGGQRIVSTHSAHIAAIASLHSYRLFRRSGSQTHISSVTPSASASWTDMTLIERFVQVQNPEILFARVVGIVEGQTEAAAFPVFARAWWPPRGIDGVGAALVHTHGAGSSKHIIRLLEALQIPWVLFCDGDQAGDNGLKAVSDVIGRALTRGSDQVVQLPVGQAFEGYVIAQGYHEEIRLAADSHSEGPLSRFRDQLEGQNKKGGVKRDYQTAGWEDRLAMDFISHHKGTIGALLAEEMCKRRALGKVALPSLFAEFFSRLDIQIGRSV